MLTNYFNDLYAHKFKNKSVTIIRNTWIGCMDIFSSRALTSFNFNYYNNDFLWLINVSTIYLDKDELFQ